MGTKEGGLFIVAIRLMGFVKGETLSGAGDVTGAEK